MKVLLVNGSRRAKGCTFAALGIVGDELAKADIDTELVHVTDDGAVDRALWLLDSCDGMVIGSPVYYASPTGEVELFMDRILGHATRDQLALKPCAVLTSARRAGTTATLDALAKYPTYAEMPLVNSCYWNMVHGNTPEEILRDEEGVQILRQLGKNMVWLLRCIEAGAAAGVKPSTAPSSHVRTNFIR